MSTYRKIHGRSIQAVTTDPTGDITEGQVWYNTVSDTFKTVLLNEAWVSASPMTTFRYGTAGGGIQTAAFVGGGYPTPSPDPTNVTEEFDGKVWSNGGNMNTARMYVGGSGTQTAGLASGGDQYPSPRYSVLVEEYDGSSWTVQNTLPTQNKNMGSCGTQTASLNIGGSVPAATNVTNSYDGTNWTNTGHNLNTARFSLRAVGTTTSALVNGGNPHLQTTEEYDGSSWTSASNSVSNFDAHSSAGTQTAARMFGGFPSPSAQHNIYDGSSWSTAPNLGTGRYYGALGPIGTSTAALMAGGNASPSPVTGVATEEFTASVNVITNAVFSSGGNYGQTTEKVGGFGANENAAIGAGGDPPGPSVMNNAYEYDGSSWTATPNLPSSRRSVAGFGTTGDGAVAGGYSGTANLNTTSEWNGSSWTDGGALNNATNRGSATTTSTVPTGLFAGGTVSEAYNGSAWTEGPTLNTPRSQAGMTGNQTAALIFGGGSPNTQMETWNGSSWSVSPQTLAQGSAGIIGGGPTTAAVTIGGLPVGRAQEYDGSSWTMTATMATPRVEGGGAGSQPSAVYFGGNTGTFSNATEEYETGSTTINTKTLTQS